MASWSVWVPAKMLWVTLRWTSIPSRGAGGGSKNTPYRNGDKCRPGGPSRLVADFTFFTSFYDIGFLWNVRNRSAF